ncbi:hypothetical protein BSNK01_09060 [Bacillaceae bacterium]
MRPAAPERYWLTQLFSWSRGMEKYVNGLRKKPALSYAWAEQLEVWSARFRKFAKNVEGELSASQQGERAYGFSAAAFALLEQSRRLHQEFSRFLQYAAFSPPWRTSYQTVNRQAEGTSPADSSLEGPGEQEKPTRLPIHYVNAAEKKEAHPPVPIGKHVLPPLPYAFDALEPYIDERTMRLHYTSHHKSYVDGLNKAELEMQKARETGDFSLLKHWEREAAFHGAGHYLHTIFWYNMKPKGGGGPTGAIAKEIDRTFGNFEKFKKHFTEAAEKAEGVGWAMLVWSPRANRTEILQAEKHQFLSQQEQIPLLVLDVWEHAYYLKYDNNRRAYIDAWWNVVNWDDVNRRFAEARKVSWKPY